VESLFVAGRNDPRRILSDNVLAYFQNYQDPASVLHQNAFRPRISTDFLADVASGNLPQVSWLVGSVLTSDHPPAPSTIW